MYLFFPISCVCLSVLLSGRVLKLYLLTLLWNFLKFLLLYFYSPITFVILFFLYIAVSSCLEKARVYLNSGVLSFLLFLTKSLYPFFFLWFLFAFVLISCY